MSNTIDGPNTGANDVLRFILELWALLAYGYWGLARNFLLMIALPALVAIVWATFAVPNDPSRGGKPIVHTPGTVRLLLEFLLLGLAFWLMYSSGLLILSLIFATLLVIHYLLAFKRIRWLLGAHGDSYVS